MNLNHSQTAAVTDQSPRIILCAAAGSGKSRVLIERIRRMIRDGVSPASIVAITFTNSAAKIIQDRLKCAACNGAGWQSSGGTPPEQEPCDACHGHEEQSDPKLGYAGTLHGFLLRLLTQHGAAIGLASKLTVLDEAEAEAMMVKCMADLAYKGTRKAVDEAVALGLARYRAKGAVHAGACRIAYEYYFRLLTNGCLTFDAMLTLGLELVQKLGQPQLGQYEHLRRFEHLLVDEVNDSAEIDFEIYEALPVKTRFLCGDSDQRIMSFRNGASNRFYDIASNAPANGWQLLPLNDCYRCGPFICEAANNLIRHNTNRIPKEMKSAALVFGELTVTTYDTAAEEAAGIAKQLKDLTASGETPWSECAVLLRTNKLASEYRQVLKDSGIPVRERKERDNPPDWLTARAFIALLTNPESDRLAHKFIALLDGSSMRADEIQRRSTADYQTINETFLHIRNMQLADVTTAMVSAHLSRESVQRVRQMIDLLQPNATVLELQGSIIEAEAEAMEMTTGVFCDTIHKSKGGEWSVVYLPAWEEGVFPSVREAADAESTAEARRLAYVAVTRARRLVAVSYARSRRKEWTGPQTMLPSRFIRETLGT